MSAASYILRHLHAMLPGALLALALFAAALPLRRRRLARLDLVSAPWREAVLALFWAWCLAMAMVLLFPSDFDLINVLRRGCEGPFFRPGEVNLTLFRTFKFSKVTLAANVLLFVPFGFCPALLWRRRNWWDAVIAAVAIPVLVENWQVFIGRCFDLDDLLLNGMGVLLGRQLWHFFGKPKLHCEER